MSKQACTNAQKEAQDVCTETYKSRTAFYSSSYVPTSQFLMILVSVSALLLPFRKLEKCDRRVE